MLQDRQAFGGDATRFQIVFVTRDLGVQLEHLLRIFSFQQLVFRGEVLQSSQRLRQGLFEDQIFKDGRKQRFRSQNRVEIHIGESSDRRSDGVSVRILAGAARRFRHRRFGQARHRA